MLTYTGCDDGLVFYVFGLLAKLADNGLRLNHRARGLLLKIERELFLPLIDLREPFGALGNFVDIGYEKGKVFGDITFDGFSSLDDFVDVLRQNLEVNDTTTTFGGSNLGIWTKF